MFIDILSCRLTVQRLGCGRHLPQDGLERLILQLLQPIVLLLAVGGTSRARQLDPAVPKNCFAGLAQECIELSAGAEVAALADLGQLVRAEPPHHQASPGAHAIYHGCRHLRVHQQMNARSCLLVSCLLLLRQLWATGGQAARLLLRVASLVEHTSCHSLLLRRPNELVRHLLNAVGRLAPVGQLIAL